MPDLLPIISINGVTPASAYSGYKFVHISTAENIAYCYSAGETVPPEHQPGNIPEYIPPVNDWPGLAAKFASPGNTLYESVRAKAAATNSLIVWDLWENLKRVIENEKYWEVARLATVINGMHQMLAANGQPMTQSDIGNWNALMGLYRFPESCRINPSPLP